MTPQGTVDDDEVRDIIRKRRSNHRRDRWRGQATHSQVSLGGIGENNRSQPGMTLSPSPSRGAIDVFHGKGEQDRVAGVREFIPANRKGIRIILFRVIELKGGKVYWEIDL